MSITDLSGIILITGTDTDAGKTVATAAVASRLASAGRRVGLCKPAQTGLAPGEPGDVETAARLAGLDASATTELVRLPEPLAPTTAARRAGIVPPTVDQMADAIIERAADYDHYLVEGAGGIHVGLDGEGRSLLDLADALASRGRSPHVLVVTRSVLGTLNHTQLTCDAIRTRGFDVAGIIVGSWPAEPDLAERCNREELADAAGAPLLALLPAGLGDDPAGLQAAAAQIA